MPPSPSPPPSRQLSSLPSTPAITAAVPLPSPPPLPSPSSPQLPPTSPQPTSPQPSSLPPPALTSPLQLPNPPSSSLRLRRSFVGGILDPPTSSSSPPLTMPLLLGLSPRLPIGVVVRNFATTTAMAGRGGPVHRRRCHHCRRPWTEAYEKARASSSPA